MTRRRLLCLFAVGPGREAGPDGRGALGDGGRGGGHASQTPGMDLNKRRGALRTAVERSASESKPKHHGRPARGHS